MIDRFERFAISVARLNRNIQKVKTAEMEKMGLKGTHTMCLYVLGKHPEGLTSGQLAANCQEDKAAISRTLTQLENMGLVQAGSQNGKIGYRTRLLLTDQGKAVVEKVNERVQEALDVGSAGLTPEERQVLYKAMDLINANLESWQ
jgi:DNA-binding MarR family transcriptional regulator